MDLFLGCIMCQIDPQSLSLAVPAAQATLIAVPFFLRSRIRAAIASAVRQRRPGRRPAFFADAVADSLADSECPRPGGGQGPPVRGSDRRTEGLDLRPGARRPR